MRKLATSILGDPPDAATFHAHLMLGSPLPGPADPLPFNDRIVRLNPLIQPVPGDGGVAWTFPPGMTRASFRYIRDLDMDAIEQKQVNAIDAFCELWLNDAIPNQAVRAGGPPLLAPEIGYARFSAGRAAALQMFP